MRQSSLDNGGLKQRSGKEDRAKQQGFGYGNEVERPPPKLAESIQGTIMVDLG
jgi:hypothetical protein